ncbi:energy transducer TonB [Stenotrophomonas humi]|uniref:energy transducer TonB n=1 Tax=Stenotrophomonas humi TaxID=405444 RepID=UPI00070FC24C|nr:energy transducer TonB [Stenotrophomonas humi]
MRNKVRLSAIAMAGMVAIMATACDKLSAPSPSTEQPSEANDDWRQGTRPSNIDGTVFFASRRIHTQNVVFDLITECRGDNWSFRVEAYDNVGNGTPFATKIQSNTLFGLNQVENLPVGRIKMQGIPVAALGRHFAATSHLNVITLDTNSLALAYAQANDGMRSFYGRRWNPAAVMKESLPLTVEVNTAAGTDELTFDRTPAILGVLDHCGGNRPLFTENGSAAPSAETATAPPPASASSLPPATVDGNYAVSFGAYASRADADAVIAAVEGFKLPGFVQQGTINGRQAWRVRIGPYATRAHAAQALDAAKRIRDDVKLEIVTLKASTDAAPTSTETPSAVPEASTATQVPPPADSPARILSAPPPRYPPNAFRNGITGTVKVAIDIDNTGRVTNVDIQQSSGNKDLDTAALEAARRWRFSPTIENGAAVASRVAMPINFALD